MMIRIRDIDWRILLGSAFTLVWLAAGLAYFLSQRLSVLDIPIENLGSFLEGAFAPLAFMWLVIGMFIQQKELSDNTEVMRQAARLSERQAEVMAATELSQRQEAFFKIADNVRRQLGSITGMLFISRFGASEGNIVSGEQISEMWRMLSTGDFEVFPRAFLGTEFDDFGGETDIFYGTEIRARHSRHYISAFDSLLELAAECDTNGVITGTITQTAHGLFYNVLKRAAPEAETVALVDATDYDQLALKGQSQG